MKKLRIISEQGILRSGEVVNKRPEDVPYLLAECKAAAKTIETGEFHYVKRQPAAALTAD